MRFSLFDNPLSRAPTATTPHSSDATEAASINAIASTATAPIDVSDGEVNPGAMGRRPPSGRPPASLLTSRDRPPMDPAIAEARAQAADAHAQVLVGMDRQAADTEVLSSSRQAWDSLARRRLAIDVAVDAAQVASLTEARREVDQRFVQHGGIVQAHLAAAHETVIAAGHATLARRAVADAAPGALETQQRAGMADYEASQARQDRDALGTAADAALQELDDAVSALGDRLHTLTSLRKATDNENRNDNGKGNKKDHRKDDLGDAAIAAEPRGAGIADALRRPWEGLRSRLAPVKVDMAIGPFAASSTVKTPTRTPGVERTARRPTSAASPRGLEAIDGKVRAAAGNAAGILATGSSTGLPKRSSREDPPVRAPAAFGSAVAFSAEVARMFPVSTPNREQSASPPALASASATQQLAQTLLDHPRRKVGARPDGHPLRYEQALLIASTLRSVTADPTRALQVHEFLRHDMPMSLAALSACTPAGAKAAILSARNDPAIERMANTARRALAASAGGFQTLLDLQGIALPDPLVGPDARRHAEQAFEHYKLRLRAEEALLTLGVKVRGRQSATDIRNALEDHPDSARLLDPRRLGTGNARRSPGGPREAEHPATLAAQAFLYATENLDRPPRSAEAQPAMKPAYVALRNGFTESGQGSDFHLMTKRLRKFVTYIDLACKTPEGRSPNNWDKLRAPVRAVRRLMGKDKSPLKTLLQAGPMGANLGSITQVGKAKADPPTLEKTRLEQARSEEDLRQLQDDFDAATPAERREILRRVMVSIVAGNDSSAYSDGRKFGVGGVFGYGVASVGGLGGWTTGVTPVGEFNLDHSRAAVFRTGVAPTTGMLFLGSERKVTGSIGAGVRVGAQAGPVVNLTAQAMARLGGSHLVSKGLMIRTKRDAEAAAKSAAAEGASSPYWNPASAEVVNSIFQIADQPAAERPAHGGAMWSQMVDKVGDLSTVSFGWNAAKTRTADVSVSLEGTAAARLGAGVGVSLVGGVGLKHTLFNKSESRDTAGALRSVQAGKGSRTALGAGVSLGISHPVIPVPGGPNLALFGRHKVGVETELVIQSTNGMVRITTEDGKVHPRLSFKHREFGVREDFIKVLNTQRAVWAARLGERGPDGQLRDGGRMLDDFLSRLVNLPPGGNRLYIERKCLTPEAAETINACMDRLSVLQRPLAPGTQRDAGAQEQQTILQQQIAARVAEESSWQPFRLVVNETVLAGTERGLGVDLRATPAAPHDASTGPSSFTERFLGGGRVTLGGHVNTAVGGRDLLMMDALPARV